MCVCMSVCMATLTSDAFGELEVEKNISQLALTVSMYGVVVLFQHYVVPLHALAALFTSMFLHRMTK